MSMQETVVKKSGNSASVLSVYTLQEWLDSTEKWLRMREFWRFTKQIYRNASRVRDQFFVYDKNEDDSKISLLDRRKI